MLPSYIVLVHDYTYHGHTIRIQWWCTACPPVARPARARAEPHSKASPCLLLLLGSEFRRVPFAFASPSLVRSPWPATPALFHACVSVTFSPAGPAQRGAPPRFSPPAAQSGACASCQPVARGRMDAPLDGCARGSSASPRTSQSHHHCGSVWMVLAARRARATTPPGARRWNLEAHGARGSTRMAGAPGPFRPFPDDEQGGFDLLRKKHDGSLRR